MKRKLFTAAACALYLVLRPAVSEAEVIYFQSLEVREMPIGNYVEWGTITEIDVANFTIEKSTDGRQFTELATLSAAGFSMVDKNYHFLDLAAQVGRTFYRLREVAEDGTSSHTLPVVLEKKTENNVQIFGLSNTQVKDVFKLTADVFVSANLDCSLSDVAGKVKQNWTYKAFNGLNTIEANLENLPPGLYHFTVKLGQEVETVLLSKVADDKTKHQPVASLPKKKGN